MIITNQSSHEYLQRMFLQLQLRYDFSHAQLIVSHVQEFQILDRSKLGSEMRVN
jgi:hypothetical protein